MLRRLLPAAALALGLCPALAQTQKGQSFYTGTFSFSKTTRDPIDLDGTVRNSRSADIDLAARAGFFVKDNFALGLGLSQEWRSSNNGGLALRPFARWYRPLGERFSGFLQTEAYYKAIRGEAVSLSEGRFGLNAGLGLVYFARKRLAIEASTNLLTFAVDRVAREELGFRNTSVNAGVNLNANAFRLGIAYYVGANPARRTPNPENALARGTRLLGGSFAFGGNTNRSTSGFQTNSGFNVNLQPQMGWFVRDNVAVGLGLGIGFSQNRFTNSFFNTPEYTQRTLSLGLRPFVRNYAMLGPRVGVFLETGLNVGFLRQANESLAATGARQEWSGRTFFLQAGLRPGATYFLGRRFAVEATTGFVGFNLLNNRTPTFTNTGRRVELKNNSFSFSPTWTLGSDVAVGLKYYIR
jgi:hypothetical protein